MNGWASGSDEMLYSMLSGRVDKIWHCDVWEFCEQYVILVGRNGNVIKALSRSCGGPKWDRVESCCVHESLALEVHKP